MSGEIKIPFAFHYDELLANSLHINIDHLVFSKFENEESKKLNAPKEMFGTKMLDDVLAFVVNDSIKFSGLLRFNHIIETDALKYWFTDLNFDMANSLLTGYMHFAVSVQDLYTTKIKFSSFYEE